MYRSTEPHCLLRWGCICWFVLYPLSLLIYWKQLLGMAVACTLLQLCVNFLEMMFAPPEKEDFESMPAVLLVPLSFIQMIFCSQTVINLALLHCPSRAGWQLSGWRSRPEAPLAASWCFPSLGGCWRPPICYQKHLPTWQVTRKPYLSFPPAPTSTQQMVRTTHGAQQKYPTGCYWQVESMKVPCEVTQSKCLHEASSDVLAHVCPACSAEPPEEMANLLKILWQHFSSSLLG